MSRAIALLMLVVPVAVQAWPPRRDKLGDPLPAGATCRLGTVRWRHPAALQSLQHSPDGKTILGIGQEASVRLWEAATGRERSRIENLGHIWFGCFSADGTVFAGLNREMVVVHDLKTDKTRKLPLEGRQLSPLALSPDGRTLILGWATTASGGNCPIESRDLTTGKVLHTFAGHSGLIQILTVTPDGKTLVSAGADARIRLWDLTTGKELPELGPAPHHQGGIAGLAISRDGKTLVSIANETAIWDLTTRKLLKRIPSIDGLQLVSVAVSDDGGRVLTIGYDRRVRMWDVSRGKELWQLPVLTYIGGACPSFAPDGKRVAVPDGTQTIRVLDVETGRDLHSTEGHQAPLLGLAFSPDNRTLATMAYDRTVQVWDVASGKRLHRLGLRGQSRAAAFSPDGKWLAAGVSEEFGGTVRVWDVATGKEKQKLEVGGTPSLGWEVYSLVFSADGKELRGQTSTKYQGWSLETGKPVRVPARDPLEGRAAILSPDSRYLIGMKNTGMDRVLLQGSTGMGIWPGMRFPITQTVTLSNSESGVNLAKYTATGQYVQPGHGLRGLMGTSQESGLLADHVALSRLSLFGDGGTVAQFSPDMRLMVSLHMGKAMMREVASGKALWKKPLPGAEAVQLAGDGRILLSVSARSVVAVWDALTGEKRGEWQSPDPQRMQSVSRDGRWLATGHPDGTVLLWDVRAMATAREGAKPAREDELEKLWADLLEEEPAKAYAAMERLTATPEAAAFVEKKLGARMADLEEDVHTLLQGLDSRRFVEREAASRKLKHLGPLARPALSQALRGKPTLEVRRRVEQLLADISVPDRLVPPGEALRRWRSVQVLEWMGARDIIARLAKGPEHALTATQARRALQRLAQSE